jgi:ribosomal protein L11 methyltransferase
MQGPLLELCPLLAGYVTIGGRILLSGILITQWPALRGAYERYFADFEVASEGDWALVTGTRTDASA